MWVTNAHGLIEGHAPDNLLAYDQEPEFCLRFTKEENELLYKMLNPKVDVNASRYSEKPIITPYLAEVLHRNGFDPEKTLEAIRVLPSKATRIGYSFLKKMQALIQQVADEDLPLFIGTQIDKDEYVFKIILEWRLKCQRK